MSQVYIAIALVVLALIAGGLVIMGRRRPRARLSPLGGVAVALVVAGIVFGERRIVGYSLMGMGVLLAILDAVRSRSRV